MPIPGSDDGREGLPIIAVADREAMHVLFYLPVVTPWWFDNIVAPLIRAAASDARVSVLVPPLWRGTG